MEYIVALGLLVGLSILVAKKNLMESSRPDNAAFTFFALASFVFLVGWWVGAEDEKNKIKWDLYCKAASNGSTVCVFPWKDPEENAPADRGTGKYNE